MTDITHHLGDYITTQNQRIWDQLKNAYSFHLFYDPLEYSWKQKIENGIVTIVTPTLEIEYHSFTHELLHAYLDFMGISSYDELLYGVTGIHSFEILVDSNLIGSIYNFCSHKKMFPYYKSMGFSEYLFVKERTNFSWKDVLAIKLLFVFKRTKPTAVNQFIGHSLALMNNIVEEDKSKCRKFLKGLKLIKPSLYKIVENFDKDWDNSQNLDLASNFLDFEQKLDEWLIKKRIINKNDLLLQ